MYYFITSGIGSFIGAFIGSFIGWFLASWAYDKWKARQDDKEELTLAPDAWYHKFVISKTDSPIGDGFGMTLGEAIDEGMRDLRESGRLSEDEKSWSD